MTCTPLVAIHVRTVGSKGDAIVPELLGWPWVIACLNIDRRPSAVLHGLAMQRGLLGGDAKQQPQSYSAKVKSKLIAVVMSAIR